MNNKFQNFKFYSEKLTLLEKREIRVSCNTNNNVGSDIKNNLSKTNTENRSFIIY